MPNGGVGATFTMTMLGELGYSLLLYFGFDIGGPRSITDVVEQAAFGFAGFTSVALLAADARGRADYLVEVPRIPALSRLSTWWRGLDVTPKAWQATPAIVTLVQ